MRINTVRCDFCNLELSYHDNRGKNDDFRTVIEATINDFKDGQFCSPECIANKAKELSSGVPLGTDILKSLAEKEGYTLTKIPKSTPTI